MSLWADARIKELFGLCAALKARVDELERKAEIPQGFQKSPDNQMRATLTTRRP